VNNRTQATLGDAKLVCSPIAIAAAVRRRCGLKRSRARPARFG
jgi:hypothetical protein